MHPLGNNTSVFEPNKIGDRLGELVDGLNEFQGFYLGPASTPPTTYPGGDPLVPGVLYYNTTNMLMYVLGSQNKRNSFG